jgi:hypothetical protein
MRISHSESNENKPEKTKRVLVRLDATNMIASDGTDQQAFAYAVIGMPAKAAYSNVADATSASDPFTAVQLVQALIAALAVSNSAYTLDETRIPRLVAGES